MSNISFYDNAFETIETCETAINISRTLQGGGDVQCCDPVVGDRGGDGRRRRGRGRIAFKWVPSRPTKVSCMATSKLSLFRSIFVPV